MPMFLKKYLTFGVSDLKDSYLNKAIILKVSTKNGNRPNLCSKKIFIPLSIFLNFCASSIRFLCTKHDVLKTLVYADLLLCKMN